MGSQEVVSNHEEPLDSTNETHSGTNVPWYKQSELRKLYILMPFLFLGSTTLGYDGSVLNGLQTMDTWQSCKKISPSNLTFNSQHRL